MDGRLTGAAQLTASLIIVARDGDLVPVLGPELVVCIHSAGDEHRAAPGRSMEILDPLSERCDLTHAEDEDGGQEDDDEEL